MKERGHHSGLLDALRGLYSQMAALVWNKRLQSYRPDSGRHVELDIAAELFHQISELAEAQPVKLHDTGAAAASQVAQPHAENPSSTPHHPFDPSPATPKEPGRLSEHFEAGRNGSELAPGLSGTLQKRTWEHIHAALRLARQGDARAAKLHADLANSAFAEAAHYMSNEDIAGFAAEVKHKLEELRT